MHLHLQLNDHRVIGSIVTLSGDNFSLYHLSCRHGDGDECAALTQGGDNQWPGSPKPKSKIQLQIDKSREIILMEAFTKVLSLKPVKKISVSIFVFTFC